MRAEAPTAALGALSVNYCRERDLHESLLGAPGTKSGKGTSIAWMESQSRHSARPLAALPFAPHAMEELPAQVLIVDDQPANVRLLEQILRRAGYENIVSTTDSRLAASLVVTGQPDIVLLDLHMPHKDGFAVL